jgi:hypothetical protein
MKAVHSMMQVNLPGSPSYTAPPSPTPRPQAKTRDDPEVQQAFQDFVGQTFFSQLLSAMRKTVHKPAYFHGGRAEEIFQGQLDQVLAEKLSDAAADCFTGPMYELFNLPRQ